MNQQLFTRPLLRALWAVLAAAHLSGCMAPGGLVVEDLDSTPDLDLGDRLVDNEIDDDGTTDEDDHDIASIGAPAFDLALRKTTGSDLVVPGELVQEAHTGTDLIRNDLGWSAGIDIVDGVVDTVAFYREHPWFLSST